MEEQHISNQSQLIQESHNLQSKESHNLQLTRNLCCLMQTGYIEWAEVKEMLMSLMQENTSLELNEEQIDAIVDQTFEEADMNKDGKIDQLEWQEMVKHHPATLSKMTLPQLKDISTQFPSFVFNSKVDDWQDGSRRPNVDRSSR